MSPTRPAALGVPAGVGHQAVRGEQAVSLPRRPTALVAFHAVRCHTWGLCTVALCRGLWHCLVRGHGGPAGSVPWQAQATCPGKTLPQLWRLTGPGATCWVACVAGAGPRVTGGPCLRGRRASFSIWEAVLLADRGGEQSGSTDNDTGLTCPWKTWEDVGGPRLAAAASPVTWGTLGLRGHLWACPRLLGILAAALVATDWAPAPLGGEWCA